MFDGLPDPAPDPVDPADLAADERDILAGKTPAYATDPDDVAPASPPVPEPASAEETDSTAEQSPLIATTDPNKPTKPRKVKLEKDTSRPLRDRVREQAGESQFDRLRFYKDIVDDPMKPLSIRMEAAKRLDEMAIDKTPTAAPLATARPRILIGHSGGIRAGSDVMKPVLPPLEPQTNA